MINTNLVVNRGYETILTNMERNKITPGALSISEDGQNLYLDSKNNERIQITDVIDLSKNRPTKYFPNKLYIDGNAIKKYRNENELDVLSELEAKVIRETSKFEYNHDFSEAKMVNSDESARIGDIIIDANNDFGILISHTFSDTENNIVVITNKLNTDILNCNEIYLDSTYGGKEEAGTYDKPYKTWDELFNNQDNQQLLTNDDHVTIFLKANTNINIDSEKFNTSLSLKNITFVSESATINIINEFKNCQSIVFNGITIICKYTTTSYVNNNNLIFKNCNIHDALFDNVSDIIFSHCTINNMYLNMCANVNIENTNIFHTLSFYNFNSELKIYNSNITVLNINETYDVYSDIVGNVYLFDCIFNKYGHINISNINSINLTNSYIDALCNNVDISANDIYLGTCNNNKLILNLIGNVHRDSGLSSIQVYDFNDRAYKNTFPTLESHLTAIDYKLSRVAGNEDGEMSYLISSGTFNTIDDVIDREQILGRQNYIGEILKYTGTEICKYNYSAQPIIKEDSIETNAFECTLSNAEYILKTGNIVEIDITPVAYAMKVISVRLDEPVIDFETGVTQNCYLYIEDTSGLKQGDYIEVYNNDGSLIGDFTIQEVNSEYIYENAYESSGLANICTYLHKQHQGPNYGYVTNDFDSYINENYYFIGVTKSNDKIEIDSKTKTISAMVSEVDKNNFKLSVLSDNLSNCLISVSPIIYDYNIYDSDRIIYLGNGLWDKLVETNNAYMREATIEELDSILN